VVVVVAVVVFVMTRATTVNIVRDI